MCVSVSVYAYNIITMVYERESACAMYAYIVCVWYKVHHKSELP